MRVEEAVKYREDLAELEHDQWRSWTKHLMDEFGDELPDNLVDRWEEKQVAYSKLEEDEKDKDRKWADKIISRVLSP